MKISIIIIQWHTLDLLKKQLSILGKVDGEMIVINNDPTLLLSAKMIGVTDAKSDVKIVNNVQNHGFSFACNQGTVLAKHDWLLFLNPDSHIDHQNVQKLLRVAEYEQLDAASPELDAEQYQKPIPSFFSLIAEFTPIGRFLPSGMFGSRTLVGGCLLIKKAVLMDLGGWDERFFLWFEDSDLSMRLQKAGYSFATVKGIQLHHEGGASFVHLNGEYRRSIFFLSMKQLAQKHFSRIAQRVLLAATARFSKATLLPADPSIRATVIVPNQKEDLLEMFLKNNSTSFDHRKDELIIVSSVPNLFSFKKKYPDVTFIQLAKKRGFAASVNIGLQRARGEFVGTVNDDTFLPKNWLGSIVAAFGPKTASVSPIILTTDKEVESFGVDVLPVGRAVRKLDTSKKYVKSMTFNGACVFFNRKALKQVGFFDERFESYLEDIDLGLRFTKAGWENLSVNTVSIIHLGQQTSRSMPTYKKWLDARNWWLVMLKDFSRKDWQDNFASILMERARNFSGLLKSLD